MDDSYGAAVIKLQMSLNKKMHEQGKISGYMYSCANELLLFKLTNISGNDIIFHSESK